MDERQIATLTRSSGAYLFIGFMPETFTWFSFGPSETGKLIRFRITIDGEVLGADHGMDTDADGYGMVNEDRPYQLDLSAMA